MDNKAPKASQSGTASDSSDKHPQSLCAPTGALSCFGCCPPIRPPGFDPIRYVSSLRREFRDQRQALLARRAQAPLEPRPIIGFHCWALGYLDGGGRRVGCLLHPCQNQGRDLRHLTDFARVCAGEQCFPARTFAALAPAGRRFWLPLAAGLSPFYYSSRTANPLFHLLRWGPNLLEDLRAEALRAHWEVTELLWHCPDLSDSGWRPRAHRYLLRKALAALPASPAGTRWNQAAALARRVLIRLRADRNKEKPRSGKGAAGYLHHLPIPNDLADFLRLECAWRDRVELAAARRMELWVEGLLQEGTPPTEDRSPRANRSERWPAGPAGIPSANA